jgi:tetraacyldisaccharide 4'-kinase
MHFPESPSLLRRLLLAPAALGYAAASGLHRALWLRPRVGNDKGLPPLVVIGSLRAGGAGKTAVAVALARHLQARGFRVGILAYWMRRRDSLDYAEILPDSDWRESSDEAVMVARALRESGARVFVTRDRAGTRDALGRTGAFDVMLADDGLMDARLGKTRGIPNVLRVVIAAPDERPGLLDLLPAGPYRLTARALRDADVVLRPEAASDGMWFQRKVVPNPDVDAEKAHWMLCGLGNPPAFLRSLESTGIRIAGISTGPDHGLPDLMRARRDAARAGTDLFLCAEKDWIKLENHPDRPGKLFPVAEKIGFSAPFLRAMEAHLAPPTS